MKRIISLLSAAAICTAALTAPTISYAENPIASDISLTASAEDLLFECGFENGTDNWEGRGDASVASSSDFALSGSKSLSCTGRTAEWNGASFPLPSSFTAGTAYSFSVNVRYEKGKSTDTFHLSLQYKDAGGETKYDKIATSTAVKGGWLQLANTSYTLPAGASEMAMYVETDSSTNAFYVDDACAAAEGTVISSKAASDFVLGDVNGNGYIDIADLTLAKQGLAKGEFSSYYQEFAADVNQSGTVTMADVVWIYQYVACKTNQYPEKAEPENPQGGSGGTDGFNYNANLQYHAIPNNYFNEPGDGGKLTKESYNCGNGTNTCWVYTPAGYNDSQKYNIFYLMHGGGENENTLFYQDDTNLKPVLDNMIKNGEIEPMIVVTPTFNKCSAQTFYQEFRKYLVPYIEGKYSTYAESTSAEDIEASRMHRAYGGFSMGSVSTWAVMRNCMDMVGYFMPLSGDHWPFDNASAQQKAEDIVKAINEGGYTDRDYFIFAATGTNDIAYPNENPQIEAMKKMTQYFTYTSDFSQGNLYFLLCPGADHWWGNVRHYVYDGLPYFFHENQ